MTMSDPPDLIPTQNGYGWTSTVPNPMTCRFLERIETLREPRVIDIGAGLGVATLPALAAGAFVIANDISEPHLQAIGKDATRAGTRDRLELLKAALPDLPHVGALDAAHASNVLHFLTGPEMEKAVAWIWDSLKPNGRAYIQVQSPYCGHFQAFLPEYFRRKKLDLQWPGEMYNAREFASPEVREMTPQFTHVMEADHARGLFERAGFGVEYCDYYRRPGLPKICWLDGRENLGLVIVRRASAGD
jgi:SAM-dependent methyltransferase